MTYTTTVTQKGQVTIPVKIREALNLKAYEKVTFDYVNDQVMLRKSTDISSLRGSIKSKKKYSDESADIAILEHVKNEYEEEKNT